MAETLQKRQRAEQEEENFSEDSKRPKPSSYTHILSILDDQDHFFDDFAPTHDLSAIFSTFQQELSPDPLCDLPDPAGPNVPPVAAADGASTSPAKAAAEEEKEKESVIRHLLEASDDELGIPNRPDGEDEINGGDCSVGFGDGLWEFEDEAANYYTLLQSELFM